MNDAGSTFDIDSRINKILADIYKDKTGQAINPDLFRNSYSQLTDAIDKGTKTLTGNVANQALINELKTNAAVLSAFKNHHQTSAIAALLVDKDGKIVPFSEFKKEALKISDKYNKNWLKTEYNTANRRAITAAKFQEYKETADIYPNLKWTPSRAKEPRDSHVRFYGLVLPIDHPFWIKQFPGNEWGCVCGLIRTKEPVTKAPDNLQTPPKGLEGNPAFTKEIIAKSHPYYKGLSEQEAANARKFASKQVSADMVEWGKQFVKEAHKPLVIKSKYLQTGQLNITRSDITRLVKQISDPFLKTYPLVLKQDIENWEYVGYSIPEGKNLDAEYFTYYKTNYGGRELFINAKVSKAVGEQPYKTTIGVDMERIIKKPLPKK